MKSIEILIDSITTQTTKINTEHLELVVSDNCSNDGTFTYLSAQKFSFKYIIIQNESNLGMMKNWLNAISHATGKYIWLLGSDDFLNEGALLKVLKAILEKNVEVIICNNIYWYPKNELTFKKSDYLTSDHSIRSSYTSNFHTNDVLEIAKTRSDAFTPIYNTIMLKEHWLNALKLYNYEKPIFSSLENTVPQAVYVSRNLAGKSAFYIGEPLVISSAEIGWKDYYPLYIYKYLPELYSYWAKKSLYNKYVEIYKEEILAHPVEKLYDFLFKKRVGFEYFSFYSFFFTFFRFRSFYSLLRKLILIKIRETFFTNESKRLNDSRF